MKKAMQKSDLIRYNHDILADKADSAGGPDIRGIAQSIDKRGICDLTDNIASDDNIDKAVSDAGLPHITVKRPVWWAALFHRYKQWRFRRRDRKALMSLNAGQLRDIGLTRGDLPYRDERKF